MAGMEEEEATSILLFSVRGVLVVVVVVVVVSWSNHVVTTGCKALSPRAGGTKFAISVVVVLILLSGGDDDSFRVNDPRATPPMALSPLAGCVNMSSMADKSTKPVVVVLILGVVSTTV
jgi:hypothetical protein